MEVLEFDSLIFDMDGTLWDAVDTYAEIWNETYRRMGVDAHVSRELLIECMGLPLDAITDRIAPTTLDRKEFETVISDVDAEIMPRDGGHLYDGVARLIPELAKRYKLFMVSNCGVHGLDYFLEFTHLKPYFTDTLTNGQTGLAKDGNIRLLCQRHELKSPVYIGDTEGDCLSAHAAGLPMMHVSYGFGKCNNADYSADSFVAVADFFIRKKQQNHSK